MQNFHTFSGLYIIMSYTLSAWSSQKVAKYLNQFNKPMGCQTVWLLSVNSDWGNSSYEAILDIANWNANTFIFLLFRHFKFNFACKSDFRLGI